MSEFTDTLRCHDDPRLYLEADILLCASADQIDKRDARVAQLEEALAVADKYIPVYLDCISINTRAEIKLINKALSTPSDTWLADKIKEADVKLLEEAVELKNQLAVSQALNVRLCEEGAPSALWKAAPVPASEWISVEDRLPDRDNEDTGLSEMVSATLFLRGIAIDGGRGFGIGDYCGDDVWRNYGGDYDFMHIEEVTHWMLPPKEQP